MGNFRLDGRTIGIGLLILLAAVVFLPRLFNTNDIDRADDRVDTAPQNDPFAGQGGGSNLDPNVQLGRIMTSTGVDRDGCPVDSTSSFRSDEDIYVVAQGSDIPAGTSVFVRLYYEGQPVEDAPEITADQDYTDSCVNFVFEPAERRFDAGQYEAEFVVNGNPAQSVTFDVR